jgi:hypothetical protein
MNTEAMGQIEQMGLLAQGYIQSRWSTPFVPHYVITLYVPQKNELIEGETKMESNRLKLNSQPIWTRVDLIEGKLNLTRTKRTPIHWNEIEPRITDENPHFRQFNLLPCPRGNQSTYDNRFRCAHLCIVSTIYRKWIRGKLRNLKFHFLLEIGLESISMIRTKSRSES